MPLGSFLADVADHDGILGGVLHGHTLEVACFGEIKEGTIADGPG